VPFGFVLSHPFASNHPTDQDLSVGTPAGEWMGHGVGTNSLCQRPSVVPRMFFEKQQQIPFGFAQGRLSTHHPQAEKRLGPRSLRMTSLVLRMTSLVLRMTSLVLLRTSETGHQYRVCVIWQLILSQCGRGRPHDSRSGDRRSLPAIPSSCGHGTS